MNTPHPSLLLLGVGGGGAVLVRGILRAFGPGIRALILDTDAQSGGNGDVPFILLGGNRLAGRGTGGQPSAARAAFQDNPALLDTALEGIRTVIIVTALGGGTGGGATSEIVKHLASRGIASIVFAALPFGFEGEERASAARIALGTIENTADAVVPMPLDALVSDIDNMKDALARAADTFATALTLFWRLLEKPGYIALDAERLRSAMADSGRARFATASATGPDRADEVMRSISRSRLLMAGGGRAPARSIFMGVLAGDDLRLSEIASVADGVRSLLGRKASFQLGTVNDEATFSGRLVVAVLAFEESAVARNTVETRRTAREAVRSRKNAEAALAASDRFSDSEKTIWRNEDLDIPTFLRRNLTLER